MREDVHTLASLRALIRTVPVYLVDEGRAEAAGDREALRYAHAIRGWLAQAAVLIAEPVEAVTLSRSERGDSRVESRRVGGRGPVVEPPPELVSIENFAPEQAADTLASDAVAVFLADPAADLASDDDVLPRLRG